MYKSYLKIAWRNLVKNRLSAVINISGLAVGLATGIIIMLVIKDELSFDRFLPNLSKIYLVMKNDKQADGISTGRSTPGLLAERLRSEVPEARYVARSTYPGPQLIASGEKSIYLTTIHADPDFFQVMQFPILQGNAMKALHDPGTAVISQSAARKLFGNESALGKIIKYNNSVSFKINAVIAEIPSNSTNQFEIVFPFKSIEDENPWLNKWDDSRILTWMLLKTSVDPGNLNRKLSGILQLQSVDKTATLFAYPLSELRLHGNFRNGKPSGGRIETVMLLAITGFFILLTACINFMNLATARSELRAREVGVRKVLGASRKLIIFQFFSEALLMTFLALIAGILLARLSLPAFNQLAEKNLSLDFLNWQVILLLLAIGLFTGLIAGSYPAVFLSRFRIVEVIKGAIVSGRGNTLLRRGLVTLQFVVSIFFIIGTIVIFKQIEFVKSRPLGYDQENLIDIRATGEVGRKFDILKNELKALPGIEYVSGGSDNLLNFGGAITGLEWTGKMPGQEIAVTATWVNYDWTSTAGLKLVEGRDFDPTFTTDTAACLINLAAVKKMGLASPVIGSSVGGKTVIGVFQDFVFNNPAGTVPPMIVFLSKAEANHILVRFKNDDRWQQTLASIGQTVKRLNPGYPFEFSFTKETYQKNFDEAKSFGLLATLCGGMAIFISCLGLFSLSAFIAERRSKEMSIRKVLGATAGSVWLALSKELLKPVVFAFLMVVPLSAWLLQTFLFKMDYHIELSWWMFAAAGLVAVLIAVLTISYQGLVTAFSNPIKSLRSE